MNNIKEILNHLPNDYESTAKTSGAMTRSREIKSAKDLTVLCLTYLFKGLTLVGISVFAAAEDIARVC